MSHVVADKKVIRLKVTQIMKIASCKNSHDKVAHFDHISTSPTESKRFYNLYCLAFVHNKHTKVGTVQCMEKSNGDRSTRHAQE